MTSHTIRGYAGGFAFSRGEHRCILRTRPGMWDRAKIGAGPPPVRIAEGWLEIYHGADEKDRY